MVEVITMPFNELRKIPKNIPGVYVCERQGNTVKCGFSSDLRTRIFQLRTTGYTNLESPRVSFVTIDMHGKWVCGSICYLEVLERWFFRFLPKPCERLEVFPCPFEEATEILKKLVSEKCQRDRPSPNWIKFTDFTKASKNEGGKSHD